jgi:hypothetical protein
MLSAELRNTERPADLADSDLGKRQQVAFRRTDPVQRLLINGELSTQGNYPYCGMNSPDVRHATAGKQARPHVNPLSIWQKKQDARD